MYSCIYGNMARKVDFKSFDPLPCPQGGSTRVQMVIDDMYERQVTFVQFLQFIHKVLTGQSKTFPLGGKDATELLAIYSVKTWC